MKRAKTLDDRIAWYIRQYSAFCDSRKSRRAIRRALRLMRYKAAMFQRYESIRAIAS